MSQPCKRNARSAWSGGDLLPLSDMVEASKAAAGCSHSIASRLRTTVGLSGSHFVRVIEMNVAAVQTKRAKRLEWGRLAAAVGHGGGIESGSRLLALHRFATTDDGWAIRQPFCSSYRDECRSRANETREALGVGETCCRCRTWWRHRKRQQAARTPSLRDYGRRLGYQAAILFELSR